MHEMIQKILVPVDGSPHMAGVVSQAIKLAKKSASTLTFLYVVSMPHTASSAEVEKQKSACMEIPEECRKKTVTEGISASSRIEVGSPVETIINIADHEKYDLIIIGSRGHSALKTLLIGSVADQVMEHAPCPVLLSK